MTSCKKINARGVRVTTDSQLKRILGVFANSKSHVQVAKRVLRLNGTDVREPPRQHIGEDELSTEPEKKNNEKQAIARQRRSDIDAAGLVANFGKLCLSAQAFLKADCTDKRKIATQAANARMVHRFVTWASSQQGHDGDKEVNLLCDTELPDQYVCVLSSVFRPFTVKNHLTAMCSLLDALLWNKDIQSAIGCTYRLKPQLKSVREVWQRLKTDAERRARRRQRAVTRSGRYANAPILWILQFLKKHAEKCEKYIEDPDLQTPQLEEMVRCVCAIYFAIHGQRLCALLNVTAKEVFEANYTQGRFVIRVADHKTRESSGPACVAFKSHQYNLIKLMAESYGRDGRAFPIRNSGQASANLFRPLNAFLCAKSKAASLPTVTCNAIRKTIESNKHLVGDSQSDNNRAITSYLCHGKQVTDLHYAYKTDQVVVAQSRLVESVVSSLAALDLVRDNAVRLAEPKGAFEIHPVCLLNRRLPATKTYLCGNSYADRSLLAGGVEM